MWSLYVSLVDYPIMRNIPVMPEICFGKSRFAADEWKECKVSLYMVHSGQG